MTARSLGKPSMKPQQKKTLIHTASAVALAAVAALVWLELRPSGLGSGFASANGRIEATEVDVATKLARISHEAGRRGR